MIVKITSLYQLDTLVDDIELVTALRTPHIANGGMRSKKRLGDVLIQIAPETVIKVASNPFIEVFL
jgi:hypothetical protein